MMAGEAEITIGVDHGRRLITVILRGPLDDSVVADCSARIRAFPEFRSGYSGLLDLTAVTSMQVTRDRVLAFVANAKDDVNRLAIIAVEPAIYGMARMYELAGGWGDDRVQVVSDWQSALEWLGLPPNESPTPDGDTPI